MYDFYMKKLFGIICFVKFVEIIISAKKLLKMIFGYDILYV